MAAKRADYFAAGTRVVWDVDVLEDDLVRVYRAADPANPMSYRRGEHAEAEPALPGWSMPVDDLFPVP
jgi:Uma2 family endonuclease